MSDHIDRAAEAIRTEVPGLSLLDRLRAARALSDAGLLVTPAHDAAVAAKALRDFRKWVGGDLDDDWEDDWMRGHNAALRDALRYADRIEARHE